MTNCPRCHRPPNGVIHLRGLRFATCDPCRVAWDTGPLAGVAAMSAATKARVFDSDDPLAVAAREAAVADLARFRIITPKEI